MIKQAKPIHASHPKPFQFNKNITNTFLSSTFINYVNNIYVYNFIFINSRNHIKITLSSNSAHTIITLTWIIKTSFYIIEFTTTTTKILHRISPTCLHQISPFSATTTTCKFHGFHPFLHITTTPKHAKYN